MNLRSILLPFTFCNLLFFFGILFLPLSTDAQLMKETVYNDSFSYPWYTGYWNCVDGTIPECNPNNQSPVQEGAKSMHISFPGPGGVVVLNKRFAGYEPSWMYPADYTNLVLYFNPGSTTHADNTINIFSDAYQAKRIVQYIGALSANTWYRVSIPLSDLQPNGQRFCTLYIQNDSATKPDFYIDNVFFERRYPLDTTKPVISNFTVGQRTYTGFTMSFKTNEPTRYELKYSFNDETKVLKEMSYGKSMTITMNDCSPGVNVAYTLSVYDTTGNKTTRTGTTSTIALPVPTLVSPAAGASVTQQLRLVWNKIANAQGYEVQVAANNKFDPLLAKVDSTSDTTITFSSLPDGITLYWRVAGIYPQGKSKFSPFRSCKIAATLTNDNIFTESLASKWYNGVWDCEGSGVSMILNSSSPVYAGSKAISVRHDCASGWGAAGFDKRSQWWETLYWMYPNQYRTVQFAFSTPDTASIKDLSLFLDNYSEPIPLSRYLAAPVPNQWYVVTVPIADLNSTGDRFFRVYFFNQGDRSPVYSLDNVRMQYVSDSKAPVISNLVADTVEPDGVSLRWQTDELTRCSIMLIAGTDTMQFTTDDYRSKHNLRIIEQLKPSTTYEYRITAFDHQIGVTPPNKATASGSFTTLPIDKQPPLLLNHAVTAISMNSAHIELSVSEVAALRVEYGVGTYNLLKEDNERKKSFHITLNGLSGGTSYQYRIYLRDRFGNDTMYVADPPMSFTTTLGRQIQYTINTTIDTYPISPSIYGTNANGLNMGVDDVEENITARRLGGNRMTGYNWENNNSHAGTDYFNQNDEYLPWYLGIDNTQWALPGIVQTTFHDTSLARGCKSLLTLQMADFVATDNNGIVSEAETAPSPRWKNVVAKKNTTLSLVPDVNDGAVYMDEQVNFLMNRYGSASSPTGVSAYSLDNEPGLWRYTHPRIHPTSVGCRELLQKSVNLSRSVKSLDPYAEIFGPAAYGYYEYLTLQGAPDWSQYSQYGTFVNAYLDYFRRASDSTGYRLLDVLDLHWYPEALGINNQGQEERITSHTVNDVGVARARMQSPRSLWDPNYVENSWIADAFGAIRLLPWLQQSIDDYYPHTKLAFTEYDYGGKWHVSGGITQADVLGVFGRYGVYFATYWGEVEGFVSSAFKLYRNYDGHRNTYGNIHCSALTTDSVLSSVYASLASGIDSTELHIIVLNKDMEETINGFFSINSPHSYYTGVVWGFSDGDSTLTQRTTLTLSNNSFVCPIPPLSAYHIVLSAQQPQPRIISGVPQGEQERPEPKIEVMPNPATGYVTFSVTKEEDGIMEAVLYDSFGKEVRRLYNGYSTKGEQQLQTDVSSLSSGVYWCQIRFGEHRLVQKFMVVNKP